MVTVALSGTRLPVFIKIMKREREKACEFRKNRQTKKCASKHKTMIKHVSLAPFFQLVKCRTVYSVYVYVYDVMETEIDKTVCVCT